VKDLVSSVSDYLFSERTRTIDVIVVSVATSFVTFILAKFASSIWSLIIKGFKNLGLRIKKLNRKYIKQKMSMKEMMELNKRLANGGKLKWYEKKPYKKYQESVPGQMQRFKEELDKAYKAGNIKLNLKPIDMKPTIPEIKLPDLNNRD
jgi:hypothetical protein